MQLGTKWISQYPITLLVIERIIGEHAAALRVDGARDVLPAGDLLVRIQSRRAKPSPARNRNRSPFRDDESAFRSALRVIFEHQLPGNIAGLFGLRTCQGRDHNAVRERDAPRGTGENNFCSVQVFTVMIGFG